MKLPNIGDGDEKGVARQSCWWAYIMNAYNVVFQYEYFINPSYKKFILKNRANL